MKKNKMKDANNFFLLFLLTICIYATLTIPHIIIMVFGWGIAYPIWLCISLSFVSLILANIIIFKYFKSNKPL